VLAMRLRGTRGTNAARVGHNPTYELGLRPNPDFWAYRDLGAPGFGFSTLWLVNTLEIGDATCGFNDPNMLSINIGTRGCDGKCR
jgi:hypothetical protein